MIIAMLFYCLEDLSKKRLARLLLVKQENAI